MSQTPTPSEQAKADELFEQWKPWLEYMALLKAMQSSRPILVFSMEDIITSPDKPDFVSCDEERSYRRGYIHGFSEAMDNLVPSNHKRSALWLKLAKFFDEALMSWRYSKDYSFQFPPKFDPKK